MWYPTIYFFNITEQKTEWEIFGAEAFIAHIQKDDDVMYLKNDAWKNGGYAEYYDCATFVNVAQWGTTIPNPDVFEMFNAA